MKNRAKYSDDDTPPKKTRLTKDVYEHGKVSFSLQKTSGGVASSLPSTSNVPMHRRTHSPPRPPPPLAAVAHVNQAIQTSSKILECIRRYDAFYRKSIALKESRPDLKAFTKMKELGWVLKDNSKRIGAIPGLPVGTQLFSRCAVAATGLHHHWMQGINYIGAKKDSPAQCVSLVMSCGGYEDDNDEGANVTYTGEGGNHILGNRRQIEDQLLVKGNLALKNSADLGNPVRLIRGHDSKDSYTGKVYTYDGLYKVTKSWSEKGKAGFVVFKFSLTRLPDQPELTTEQVRFYKGLNKKKKDIKTLPGLVAEDISGGQEALPIPAVNAVDESPDAPSGFTYTIENILPQGFKKPPLPVGCNCKGKCYDNPQGRPITCACAVRNGGGIPYVDDNGGRLVFARSAVFECGPNCRCGPDCPNRATQRGLRFRLEVFKTTNKGWAVRSWDLIPSGAPVCEYTGKLMTSTDAETLRGNDEYLFDLDCIKTAQGVDGRQPRFGEVLMTNKETEDSEAPYEEYSIDANHRGSVARFVNHSCSPNLFVQSVFNEHHDLRFPHLWLCAADNILPFTELTYDYGYKEGSVVVNGEVQELLCHCAAENCTGRLY